jgi:hypothetical protein
MKTTGITQAAFFSMIMISLVSCRPARDYRHYPPPPHPPRVSMSLIISPGPGIAVNRFHDGRYYYRSPNGFIYWRGYNNRYYLDRKYINPYRNHNQYNEWRRYYNRRR